MAMAVGFSHALYQIIWSNLFYIAQVDVGTASSAGFQHIGIAPIRAWFEPCSRLSEPSVTPYARRNILTAIYALLRTSDPARRRRSMPVPFEFAVREGEKRDRRHRGQQHHALPNPIRSTGRSSSATARARKLPWRRFLRHRHRDITPPQDEGVVRLNPIGLLSISAILTGPHS